MGIVPVDGAGHATGEVFVRGPSEFAFAFGAIDGVPAVVTGAVFDVGDEVSGGPALIRG